ncbi:unnamed protein product [Brassicogethes aeneus]|uniref:TIL domain-containing protein n=1 Tax=Brassicogethes aeneus TaxID=1431903 RepID=A0A9P0BK42_BRAAE|nr:unnamed protein product [Brassicogethes aeneus]
MKLLIFLLLTVLLINITNGSKTCPENEVFEECQSSSCRDLPCGVKKASFCTADCVTGCFCADGYGRKNRRDKCEKC